MIPFLHQQGEMPKAEGVLLHQVLSVTRTGRTPSVAPRRLPPRLREDRLCEGEQVNRRPPLRRGYLAEASTCVDAIGASMAASRPRGTDRDSRGGARE